MKIALAQIDPTVGDFDGNRAKILAGAARAREAGTRLAVFLPFGRRSPAARPSTPCPGLLS
ncbi:MAG: hypothetical protein HY720_32925 [Planctomycetes bacterium]|nr:hypothetical protein [Planctomycetota bacterium]